VPTEPPDDFTPISRGPRRPETRMRRPAPSTRRPRIRVEALEDRALPSFVLPPTVVVGPKGGLDSKPAAIVTADFNRDGKPDVATANDGAQGVSILLGTGTGGFKPARNVSLGRAPAYLLATDVNGDGKTDLVTANMDDNSVTVLIGNGLGGFTSAGTVAAGNHPVWVAAGDFNQDGNPDLAVADSGNGSSVLTLLLGAGRGRFNPGGTVTVGTKPQAVAIGDFNEDGKLDLASVGGSTNHLNVNLGNGNGTFAAPTAFATASVPTSMAMGDFNHDGHIDVAVGIAFPSSGISILLGTGAGTFPTHTDISAADESIVTLVAADLNHDGNLDLVTANGQFSTNSISVVTGNADGTFNRGTFYVANQNPQGVAVGDFNSDGWPDVAAIGTGKPIGTKPGQLGTVSTLFGNGDGTLVAPADLALNADPGPEVIADFNNDGKNDLAVVTNRIQLFTGLGNGGFDPVAAQNININGPNAIVARDFNGDGNMDMVVTNGAGANVYLGVGDGSFQAPVVYAVGGSPTWITTADINNDGKLDVVVSTGGGASVLLGNGDGTFQAALGVSIGGAASHIAAGDFNRDGKIDLASIDGGNSRLNVVLGNGNGTFGAATTYTTAHSPDAVEAGDFNGDGRTDLAVTTFFGGGFTIFQALPNGKFAEKATYPTDTLPIGCVIADFNGDHKLDIATVNEFGDTVSQYFGTGLGTFGRMARYVIGDFPTWGAAGDLNGDGLPELITSNSNCGSLTVLSTPTRAVGFHTTVTPATTAGHAVVVTVSAVDAAGRLAPWFGGSVKLTSTDPQAALPPAYTYTTAAHGTHRFLVTLKTAGSQDIVAHLGTVTGTATVDVSPATATHLVVRAPTAATAGSPFDVTVVAADPFGNPDPNYAGMVHFASTDLAVGVALPADYTFTGTDAGTHTFAGGGTLLTAGARTMTVVGGAWRATAKVAVAAGTVAQFLVTGFPPTIGANVAHTFTVTAQDAYGNTVTNYTGTVQFSNTGVTVLPGSYTFTTLNRGKHTFSATFTSTGTGQALTVTDQADSSITGSETGITVT
jgi:hypothetical protein